MYKYLFFALAGLFFINQANAQINIGGLPPSFSDSVRQVLNNKSIPIINLPAPDLEKIKNEDKHKQYKDMPWRFGVNIKTDISPDNAGIKTYFKDSSYLWQLRISSEGAQTLNFAFDFFELPPGGLFYIYNSDKTMILGGFTVANNQASKSFATDLLIGDEAVLEYYHPAEADFEVSLHLFNVTHGYRSLNAVKGFGDSDYCNMNVACPDGDEWRQEIRSVCMLVSNMNGFCTGALLNNTKQDQTPYVLTADHCLVNPNYTVFRFNWESETCDNPTFIPAYNSLNGAEAQANSYESDFALFKLNDTPPADYNVYYAGWNRSDEPPPSAVGIHHPVGDIKKLAFDDDPVSSSDYEPSPYWPDSHWKIESWERNTTTEPGSSGSPLFDDNKLIIGQLHGGWAACSNNDADFYGKLSYSWNYLQEYLDPIDSGLEQIPGYDPNTLLYERDIQVYQLMSPQSKMGVEDPFKPQVDFINLGTEKINSFKIKLSINEEEAFYYIENNTDIESRGIYQLTIDTLISLPAGTYELSLEVESINGAEDQNALNDQINRSFTIYEQIFFDDFESDFYREMTGEFEVGFPEQVGDYGPEHAASGNNLLGTDLSGQGQQPGNYEANIEKEAYTAATPVIDASGFKTIWFSFKRHAAIDDDTEAKIILWSEKDSLTLWSNKGRPVNDGRYVISSFDISEFASNKRIRIKYYLGSSSVAGTLSGWNIDDISVFGERFAQYQTEKKEGFLLYPNPSKGIFHIELAEETKSVFNISLINLSGHKLKNIVVEGDDFMRIGTANSYLLYSLDFSDMQAGLYILKIENGDKTYSRKIYISRNKE